MTENKKTAHAVILWEFIITSDIIWMHHKWESQNKKRKIQVLRFLLRAFGNFLFKIDCIYNHFGKRVYIFLAIVIEPSHRYVEQHARIKVRGIAMRRKQALSTASITFL